MGIGVELGIRAPQKAIERAAEISDKNEIDYFFVPETHPSVYGVDAFESLLKLSEKTKHVTLGTGIVNVFSRSKEQILSASEKLYSRTGGRFVLGIGTSAPVIIEKLWKMQFKNPLSRLKEYTEFIRENFKGDIFWAAVGEKTVREAARNADGVLFFLKPKSQIKKDVILIKQNLTNPENTFEVVSIVPTYIITEQDSFQAKMTLASYLGANEFYSKPLAKAGFESEVNKIKSIHNDLGLKEAAKNISDKLIDELVVFGSPQECAKKIFDKKKDLPLSSIILGFDLPESGYTNNFFNELENLLRDIK